MTHGIIGMIIGGITGFVFYKIIGCPLGGCPITSNPYLSTILGSLLGFFILSGFGG